MSALPITPPTTRDTATPDADIAADRSPTAGSHPAHTAHPDALRERAVALYCEGMRSPAIAAQLGPSERTVRTWLADARRAFAQQDAGADAVSLHERLALAVERQLAIAAAAWQSYHHAVLLDQLALDHHRLVAEQAPDRRTPTGEVPPPPPPPRPSTACARFLSVALAAQREAARLQGCYDYPACSSAASAVQSHIPAKTATATSPSPALPASPVPAKTAATPDRQLECAATPPPQPALSPIPFVTSAVHPPDPRSTAKTATASPASPPRTPLTPLMPLMPLMPPCESPCLHAIHASPPPHAWQRIL